MHRHKFHIGLVFLSLFFAHFLFSCRDCNMETEDIHTVRLGFFSVSADGKTEKAVDTSFTKIYGLDNNDLALYPKTGDAATLKRNIFELPLNTNVMETAYIFVSGTKKDTVYFRYTQKYSVYTPDCGYSVQINDFTVYKTTFKKFVISSKTLTSLNKYDIKIYP